MSIAEANEIARVILNAGPLHLSWSVYAVGALVTLLAAFFGTYIAEKGKNTATKEDVAVITRQIENVRAEYTEKLESLKGSYQLRAVALEQRLEAHQEAFTLWRELISSVHNEQNRATVKKCEDWWTSHCLYLAAEARAAFMTAVSAAHSHPFHLETKQSREKVDANWAKILAAGDAIVRGADLPPLPDESATLTPNKPKA